MENMIDNTGETLHEAGGVPELPEPAFWLSEGMANAFEEAGNGANETVPMFGQHQLRAYGEQCALAALAARPLSGGWEPIGTAPKDGSWFLAYRPKKEGGSGHVAQVHWKCDNLGVMCFGGAGWAYAPNGMPTHWMAMPPAPPAGTDEGGR